MIPVIVRIATFSLLAIMLAGCGGSAAGDDAVASDEAENELRSSGIAQLTVGRSTGFSPPPPAGGCRASGRWTADLEARTIEGQACTDAHATTIHRALTTQEVDLIRAAVSAVRTAPRPAHCPTDVPVASLEIVRPTK